MCCLQSILCLDSTSLPGAGHTCALPSHLYRIHTLIRADPASAATSPSSPTSSSPPNTSPPPSKRSSTHAGKSTPSPAGLQALHVLLQATVTAYPIIVTIVFWALLSSSSTLVRGLTVVATWSNISIHALNTPFALFEIFLTNALPAPWLALPFVVFVLALYLALVYVVHATQGFYPYPFLNPANCHGLLAKYILGIAAGGVIVTSIVRGVVVLRCRWRTGRGTVGEKDEGSGPTREGLEEWEAVQVPTGMTAYNEMDLIYGSVEFSPKSFLVVESPHRAFFLST
ncbi:hypothetical protein C8R44DRAFT_745359 [Mycena epipterygia]|nr:hypothetical protein C8R44DRAFT_745359 [Mycena epipterygia]